MKDKNNLLYTIRGGATLLVILIHCSFPGIFGAYIKAIARMAVPVFLMISGYYTFENDRDMELQRIKLSIRKAGKLAIIVLLIYSAANCVNAIFVGKSPFSWLTSHLSVSDMIGLIVFNHSVFITAIMWYFLALLYVYFIVLLAMKLGVLNVLICSTPLWLVLNIFSGEIMKWPWYISGNFLLTGLPFFLIGYWIHKENICRKLAKANLWGILIFGMLLTMIEATMFGNIYVYIGSIFSAFAIFCLSFKYKIHRKNFLTIIGERSSTYIFVLHGLVIMIVDKLNLSIPIEIWIWIKPLVIIMVSMCVSIFLRRIVISINACKGNKLKNLS